MFSFDIRGIVQSKLHYLATTCAYSPLFFFLFILQPIQAQSPVDSVLTSIQQKPDSSIIIYLNDLCWKNRADRPRFSFECGQKALEIGQKTGNKTLIARSLNLLGVVCRVLGYYDQSLAYLRNALITAEESNNAVELGFAHNNIGNSYRLKGFYSAAMQHLLSGLKAFESVNYKDGIAYSLRSVGFIYLDQKDFPRAINNFDHAYNLRLEVGDIAGAGVELTQVAKAYGLQNDFTKAIELSKKAEQLFVSINDQGNLQAISISLGDTYLQQKNYSAALPLYESAYQRACKQNNNGMQVASAIKLGRIFTRFQKFSEAEHYLQAALKLAGTMQEYGILLDAYSAYSDFYSHSGKPGEALRFSMLYIALKDSILTRENISGVQEMEAMYENKKTQTENTLLLKNIENTSSQRNYLIAILVLSICLSALFAWKNISQKKAKEKIRLINEELKALNETRDKFFSIIAHDLRSPFQMLLGVSELLSTEIETLNPEQVKKFSIGLHTGIKRQFELLNDLLEWSKLQRGDFPLDKKVLSLQEEAEQIVDALTVPIQIKDIIVKTNIPRELLILADSNMLQLVLRNLISNSIKFVLPKGTITISGESINSFVKITISDDGVGISEGSLEKLFRPDTRITTTGTANEKGTGFGLLLCKEIVEKHGGTIWVENIPGKGASFSFTVPD